MASPPSPPDVRFLVADPRPVDGLAARAAGVAPADLQPLDALPHPARWRALRVSEAWATVDLDARWRVAYRLAVQAGAVIVSEVRLYPRERDAAADRVLDPGTWRAAYHGWGADVPLGGITARLLRRITLGAHHRVADAVLGQIGQATDPDPLLRDVAHRASLTTLTEPRPRTGRPRRPLLHYARVAARYVDAIERGSRRPAQDVADALGVSGGLIRQWLHAARGHRLLSRVPSEGRRGQQGQKGGTLTLKAKALLAAAAAAPRAGAPPRPGRRRRPSPTPTRRTR